MTRHEPHYEWDLHYAGKADYLAGLGKLRTAWGHRGWKVHDTPPPEGSTPGRPVPNWPGLSTTDDHGITIAIYLDEYTHTPTLSTSGGCIRYDRDDGVTARKRTGAGEQPAREGAITYDDGVQVTIGPIQAITPNPGMKDEGAADGHTYLLPVIVTNRSGAPVELRDGIGARKGANPGVRWLPGYSLLPGGPATVPEGSSTRLETVFTAQTLPSHMNISYQPSELHASYDWQLTTR
ncbi:hypothetical protein ACIHFE_30050 [Streptomyces sp. NPDC052396]|uniref:hypothetical protein n=1 Tax=Streptomyces sp. NPDC052396 TaxID=3365689 RepID=UPI0037D3B745